MGFLFVDAVGGASFGEHPRSQDHSVGNASDKIV